MTFFSRFPHSSSFLITVLPSRGSRSLITVRSRSWLVVLELVGLEVRRLLVDDVLGEIEHVLG
jgi:hypothetical protein